MTTTTKTTPADRERAMFGVTLEGLQGFVREHVGAGKPFASRVEAATSMLSDAQELMALGHIEDARKTINRAKWLINER